MRWLMLWLVSLAGLVSAGIVGLLNIWAFLGGMVWFGVVTFLLVWYFLAPANRFFTFVKEGTAKIVVRGDKFERVLIQWEGYTFDNEWNVVPAGVWLDRDGQPLDPEILRDTRIEVERFGRGRFARFIGERRITGEDGTEEVREVVVAEGFLYQEPWHPFGGLRLYGLWPIHDIYVYSFQWTGVAEDGSIVRHPRETLDYILLRDDVYYARIEECEDKNLLPLDIELVLTIRVINPYRALFNVQNWLETVINRTRPAVRDAITSREYSEWITQIEQLGDEIFSRLETRELAREFTDRYGIELRRIQVKNIEPPAEYREKTLAPYLADLDRRAIVIRADAEKTRIGVEYGAVRDMGDLGQLIRTLEALEESPAQGAKWVVPLPGMAEILSKVFPGRAPDTLTREELIRVIQEEIGKARSG